MPGKEEVIINDYELLDSGDGAKLERFGPVTLNRPCAQAIWPPAHPEIWRQADAVFDRRGGLNWHGRESLPGSWTVVVNGVRMKLSTTDFGHLGVFPETRSLWDWMGAVISRARTPVRFLNLFAYSGGATIAAARAGASCCHLDSSRGMVQWARENAALNGLQTAPIRWIVDDVHKFLQREIRRDRKYDAIWLDPPSFGRGKHGELYKIEKDLVGTLRQVRDVLSNTPLFVILTSHTPGFSPVILQNMLACMFDGGELDCGEMMLTGKPGVLELPNGNWARWTVKRQNSD